MYKRNQYKSFPTKKYRRQTNSVKPIKHLLQNFTPTTLNHPVDSRLIHNLTLAGQLFIQL